MLGPSKKGTRFIAWFSIKMDWWQCPTLTCSSSFCTYYNVYTIPTMLSSLIGKTSDRNKLTFLVQYSSLKITKNQFWGKSFTLNILTFWSFEKIEHSLEDMFVQYVIDSILLYPRDPETDMDAVVFKWIFAPPNWWWSVYTWMLCAAKTVIEAQIGAYQNQQQLRHHWQ